MTKAAIDVVNRSRMLALVFQLICLEGTPSYF